VADLRGLKRDSILGPKKGGGARGGETTGGRVVEQPRLFKMLKVKRKDRGNERREADRRVGGRT